MRQASPSDTEDRAAVRFPPPTIPLATVLLGLALERLWPLSAALHPPAPLRYGLGGAVLAASVLVLGVWPLLLFRRSGQDPEPWKPTPSVVEEGPYRITRNPMYLMMVIACVGISFSLANVWILALTPLCGALLQRLAILPEEAYLERKFGQRYFDYKRRVRRWI